MTTHHLERSPSDHGCGHDGCIIELESNFFFAAVQFPLASRRDPPPQSWRYCYSLLQIPKGASKFGHNSTVIDRFFFLGVVFILTNESIARSDGALHNHSSVNF